MPSGSEFSVNPSSLAADLVALATEPSSEKRVELLRRITDAYLVASDGRSTAEQYLFEEVISRLIEKISAPHKAEASVALAQMPSVPEVLVDRLVNDRDIDVAGPILRSYGNISEKTLVRVAKDGSQNHLQAIATRPVVTPPVTDVVVVRGNQTVVRTLAGNAGAQFSDKGMNTLIGRSADDPALQALIVERPDLSPGALANLLPLISQELTTRLRGTAVELNEAAIQGHLNEWAKDRQNNISRTESYIERVRKGDLRLNDVVIEFVRAKRLLDAATIIAAVVDMDRRYTFNILSSGKMDAVILLMKSVDLAWPAVDGFLKLRIAKTGIGEFDAYPRRRDYDAMDPFAAQRVIRFMKVRKVTVAKAG